MSNKPKCKKGDGCCTNDEIIAHNNAYIASRERDQQRSTDMMEDDDDEPIITVEPERPFNMKARKDASEENNDALVHGKKKLKKTTIRDIKDPNLYKKIQRMVYLNTVVKYWKLDPKHMTIPILLACCDEEETKYITSNLDAEEKIVPGDIPQDDTIRMLCGHMDRSAERFLKLLNEHQNMMAEQHYKCKACNLIPDKINKKATLFRCTKCKNVWYCDATCQLSDWKQGHKKICGK